MRLALDALVDRLGSERSGLSAVFKQRLSPPAPNAGVKGSCFAGVLAGAYSNADLDVLRYGGMAKVMARLVPGLMETIKPGTRHPATCQWAHDVVAVRTAVDGLTLLRT